MKAEGQFPLLNQSHVQANMHACLPQGKGLAGGSNILNMSGEVPWIRMNIRRNFTECNRCASDKGVPKLYSSANNMYPGVVPPQLQVRRYFSLQKKLYYNSACP